MLYKCITTYISYSDVEVVSSCSNLRVLVLSRWSYQSMTGVEIISVDNAQVDFCVGIWCHVSGLYVCT